MDKTLRAGLPAMNLNLTEAQQKTLCAYGEAMLEKNKVMNLTAITEPERVAELHFLDSLALLNLTDFQGKKVIDVGCGAGLPGVPLKIGEQSIDLTLLDSLGKRMDWLREILPQLGVVVTARAEEAVVQRRESYDIAVSRAVARLNMLCELCLPYVKVGGVFLAMKGALAEEETAEAAKAIRTLGGELDRIAEYPIAGAMHRVAVIRKVKKTPPAYPRRFAKIKQQPL